MRTIFCRGCGVEIHEEATSCPHCGAPQARAAPSPTAYAAGSPWLAWTALACGLFAAGMSIDDGRWDHDEIGGLCCIGFVAAVLGGLSLAQRRPGKLISIVALVTGLVGLLSGIARFR